MGSLLSDSIAGYEREAERLKVTSRRKYVAAASRSIPTVPQCWNWSRTYKLHGPVTRLPSGSYRDPSPDDIAYACRCINAHRESIEVYGYDDEPIGPEVNKVYADPRITARYMPSEKESQLCDCPYWGTEFS